MQKLAKAELKLKLKSWLTRGIMTSIKNIYIIYKKISKAKHSGQKIFYIMNSNTIHQTISSHQIK